MKKLVTIFALFTMVMLTSFVEPNEVGGKGRGLDQGKTNIESNSTHDVGGRDRGTQQG